MSVKLSVCTHRNGTTVVNVPERVMLLIVEVDQGLVRFRDIQKFFEFSVPLPELVHFELENPVPPDPPADPRIEVQELRVHMPADMTQEDVARLMTPGT